MTTPLPRFKSPKDCHNWLRAHGINVSELARANDLPRLVLVDLLRGRNKGYRGKAHRAAILLGLKDDPTTLKPEQLAA